MKYLLFIYDRYDCPSIIGSLVDSFQELEAVEAYLVNCRGEDYRQREAEVLTLSDEGELKRAANYGYSSELAQWLEEAR